VTPSINIGTANAAKTIAIGSTTDIVSLNANALTVTTPGSCTFLNRISANGGIGSTTGTLSLAPDVGTARVNVGRTTGSPTYVIGAGAGGDQVTPNAPNTYLDPVTGQLMRSSSTIVANAYVQGGNSFGAPGILGIMDSVGGLGVVGYGLTIETGSGFSTAGNITIQPGNGLTAGGSVIIDSGSGGLPTVAIGGTNASMVNIGRSGQLTDIKGDFMVDGDTVNLANGVNTNAKVVNIATNGSGAPGTSTITLGALATPSTIALGQHPADIASVRGTLSVNGQIESAAGAVNIATQAVPGTLGINIATAPALNQFVTIGNTVNHLNVSVADANFLGATVVTCQGRLNAEGTGLVGGIEATNTGMLNIGTAMNGLIPVTPTINLGTAPAFKSINIGNITDNVFINANNLTITALTACTFVNPLSASGGVVSATGTLNLGCDTTTSFINIGCSPSTAQTVNIGSSGAGATSILIAGTGDKVGIGGAVSAGTEVLKVSGDTWMTGNLQVDGTTINLGPAGGPATIAVGQNVGDTVTVTGTLVAPQNQVSLSGIVSPVVPAAAVYNPAGGVRLSHGSVIAGSLARNTVDIASAVPGGGGLWTINFAVPYPPLPVVVVTPEYIPGLFATAQVFNVTPVSFDVQTYVGGAPTTIDFNFMIMGLN
jgi:hypothetical protein